MTTHLPDPQWSEAAALCPACGYSLTGLAFPVTCPECGQLHTGRQFIVHGVPSIRSATKPWRLAAIIILCTGSFCLLQALGFFLAMNLGWLFLFIIGTLILATIALIVTGGRGRNGSKCRMIFVDRGVYLTPLKIDAAKEISADQGFIRFSGDERATLTPVGTAWAHLRLARPDGTVPFRAGIRCPRERADELLATIDELIRGRSANATGAPPTA
ncbi:MAG: hypothetical protein KF678_08210 [Phycisphaeraceae bacterium]|nr:hypothetical protein [Phycisphaeraceae bacterium]